MPRTYLTDLHNQLMMVLHEYMNFFFKKCDAEIIIVDNHVVKWTNQLKQIAAIWANL